MSLVAELVDECCRRVDGRAVSLVRVRCSLPDIDGELQQAFTMLTAATPLQDAVLQVETLPVIVDCPCGYVGPAAEDVLVGHLFVCPDCSRGLFGLQLWSCSRSACHCRPRFRAK